MGKRGKTSVSQLLPLARLDPRRSLGRKGKGRGERGEGAEMLGEKIRMVGENGEGRDLVKKRREEVLLSPLGTLGATGGREFPMGELGLLRAVWPGSRWNGIAL